MNKNKNKNKIKDALLGMPHGTANNKLRKSIIFMLASKLNMLFCFRCNTEILEINTLSIEHKKAWQQAIEPKAAFFDLKNIAFSHLRCNISVGNRDHAKESRPGRYKVGDRNELWCGREHKFLLKEKFSKNVSNRTEYQSMCNKCRSKSRAKNT